MLIINADDFGMNEKCTDRIIAAYDEESITSATAMVFMQDTARAADLSQSGNMSIGLHLNFTTPFSGPTRNEKLQNHHRKLMRFFGSGRYWRYSYNPAISESIRYCFQAQYDEFLRVFEKKPTHIDGHHHIHLAANVVFGRVLPDGIKIRKNRDPDYQARALDSLCRNCVSYYLRKRFITTDFFYTICPLVDSQLAKKILTARTMIVEIVVHPERDDEFSYINTDNYSQLINAASKGSYLNLDEDCALLRKHSVANM